jgi:hypothetical protein
MKRSNQRYRSCAALLPVVFEIGYRVPRPSLSLPPTHRLSETLYTGMYNRGVGLGEKRWRKTRRKRLHLSQAAQPARRTLYGCMQARRPLAYKYHSS